MTELQRRLTEFFQEKLANPDLPPEYLEEEVLCWGIERNLVSYDEYTEAKIFKEELTEYHEAKTDHDTIDALCDMFVVYTQTLAKAGNVGVVIDSQEKYYLRYTTTLFEIEYMGYDPMKCMEQCLLEINSRKGKINEETGKFEKILTGDEYTADYSKCLLSS